MPSISLIRPFPCFWFSVICHHKSLIIRNPLENSQNRKLGPLLEEGCKCESVVSGTAKGAGGPLHWNLGLDSMKRDSFFKRRSWYVIMRGMHFPRLRSSIALVVANVLLLLARLHGVVLVHRQVLKEF